MKAETPEQFVQWLLEQMENPNERTNLTWTELYGRLMKVELGESFRVQAIREHERLRTMVEAGFTETQAFAYLLNERAGLMSGAGAQAMRWVQENGG